MSRIMLSNLILRNFKGIKHMEINFTKLTNIKGDNGTGKTTIFDAFTWLLFDKDSADRAAFEIKTLDRNNEALHGLEHEVTGTLNVDGKMIRLSKIFKEKWTKKKGEADKLLTGHETLYFVNEVPVKQSEYKDTIARFISEQLFKLISSPIYFSLNMKWQDRRNVLMDIIGDIKAERILNHNSRLSSLMPLLQHSDVDTLKRSIAARKKRLNESIKSIPYRIDELNNSLSELDFSDLEFKEMKYAAALKTVEEKLVEFSGGSEEALKDKNRLYELIGQLHKMEYKAREKADNRRREISDRLRNIEYDLKNLMYIIEEETKRRESYLDSIKSLEEKNKALKVKWYEIEEEQCIIDEENFICPTCHRPFVEHDAEDIKAGLEKNFNDDKARRQDKISVEGKGNLEKIAEYELKLKEQETKLRSLKEKAGILEEDKLSAEEEAINFVPHLDMEQDSDYMELKNQVGELEVKLSKPEQLSRDIDTLKAQRAEYGSKLEECRKALGIKEQNDRIRTRIKELLEEEKELSEAVAELENQEFLCEEYTKTKVELLEASINGRFKFVRFKLFNTLVNGAVEDCCEALIDGVPFSNANKASQINGGLDIINALCSYYGVQAPIFIDNRESINKILDSDSQIINLVVSNDKTLVIEGMESKIENNEKISKDAAFKLMDVNLFERKLPIETMDEKPVVLKNTVAKGPGF